MNSNLTDLPAKADEDSLNMKAYAEALTAFVKGARAPLTIALQGEWGSGKTSLMNALKAALTEGSDATFLGVWINTWQYALMANSEEAILSILMGIIRQVSGVAKTTPEERKSIFHKFLRLGGSVASDILKKHTGVDFKAGLEEWNGKEDEQVKSGVEDLKSELAGLVRQALEKEKGKRGFLFFIDDLDRIDPPEAVQILELLKNVFDLENCIFVLAIDYGVVVKGLKPKFGEMTPENEREFRSFFDKIIQLPFAMPVASYKIDHFLMDSLADIGYLDSKEKDDKHLCESLTYYALQSVGTNPRSLKRLINYLSLIRLIIERTPTQEDDADFAAWKDVLFALVSLQIQYPKVYEALLAAPDFPQWGEAFEQKWRVPALAEGEKEKLAKMEEFDEPWEQLLFRFCRRDTFLESRALNISRSLNRIRARIIEANQPVGDTVEWLMRLSSVTSVKSETEQAATPENFNKSEYLKDLRWHTLGLRPIPGKKGWQMLLAQGCYLSSWQARVQTNLACELWSKKRSVDDKNDDGYLTEPYFHIYHDGKSFQLKMWGEFWGNWPKARYAGIDFAAESIQADLKAAEAAYCTIWTPLGFAASVDRNIGHHPGNLWWNATVPFKNHDELVSSEFGQKLRGALAKLAEALEPLLAHRKRKE